LCLSGKFARMAIEGYRAAFPVGPIQPGKDYTFVIIKIH
jgi:hypothetical protein